MAHVEHLIHFCPICTTLLLNSLEKRWNREHVVFHHSAIFSHEVKHFGLRTTRAMYHAMNLRTKLVEQFLHHRGVGAGRGQHQFASADRSTLHFVLQGIASAKYQFLRYLMVETLWIFHGKILGKHIVPCTRQSIASHTTIVFGLVSGLSATR